VIGCINFAKDFVVSGTATDKLFGMAESLWEPDLVSPPISYPTYLVLMEYIGTRGFVRNHFADADERGRPGRFLWLGSYRSRHVSAHLVFPLRIESRT
jgi:hypothetical protein